jgi:hypothetical protein
VAAIEHFFGVGPRPAEFGLPAPVAAPAPRRSNEQLAAA